MAYNGKICLSGGIDMDFTVFQGISILVIFLLVVIILFRKGE